jgi:hypothetical protein
VTDLIDNALLTVAHVVTPSSPFRPAFQLSLDYSVALPLILKDVNSSISTSPSLESIVTQRPQGPPGKFYRKEPALAVLDSLATGGSSARVSLDLDSDEKQAQIFERFVAKLRAGELVSRVVRVTFECSLRVFS